MTTPRKGDTVAIQQGENVISFHPAGYSGQSSTVQAAFLVCFQIPVLSVFQVLPL